MEVKAPGLSPSAPRAVEETLLFGRRTPAFRAIARRSLTDRTEGRAWAWKKRPGAVSAKSLPIIQPIRRKVHARRSPAAQKKLVLRARRASDGFVK
jgi:hypothetical protein